MNIVISSSLNEITLVGSTVNIDLDSVKLFISKDITDQTKIFIQLEGENSIYPLEKIAIPQLDKNTYKGYRISSKVAIMDGIYNLKAYNEDSLIGSGEISLLNSEILMDEHQPIYIIGRTINAITTQVVAQDVNSQQFTFYIKRKYDGISFLDESKKVYVDYIPVEKEDLIIDGIEVSFLSDEIPFEKITSIMPPNEQNEEWLALKWDLPYTATKTAGSVRFDIAVIAENGDEREYTWQTIPSSFTVLPNLGFRKGIVLTPEDESILTDLTNKVNTLEEDFNSLKTSFDEDPNNDAQEIFIIGGSAPISNEEV